MIQSKVEGVEFICMNTDTQDLHNSLAAKKIHIGRNLTKGQGTGMNPQMGQEAAEETKAEIQEALKGADMVFIACGMGGGTGTGAAPIVASIARDQGALTIGVVTKPFSFEGQQRSRVADGGLSALEKNVDALIVVPNDRLLTITSKDTTFKDAFGMSDEILRQAVEGISELITTQGVINIDFADVRAIMEGGGVGFIAVGEGKSNDKVKAAAEGVIKNRLLDVDFEGAKGALIHITGGSDLILGDAIKAGEIITEKMDSEANVKWGARIMQNYESKLEIVAIVTGVKGASVAGGQITNESETSSMSAYSHDLEVLG
jgi:cell division protein FtsZ